MGIRENLKYKTSKIKLNKDNELFVYTDGLTEAHDMENNLFSEEKLISTLNKTAAANLNTIDTINKVKNEIKIFKKETEQFDDITMLLIKIK